ncbi:MAG: phage terminase large subunit family protein [Magnetococcales bacterium]|nr:phage terminase large subunit family protein [Magnetococcales bacterium]
MGTTSPWRSRRSRTLWRQRGLLGGQGRPNPPGQVIFGANVSYVGDNGAQVRRFLWWIDTRETFQVSQISCLSSRTSHAISPDAQFSGCFSTMQQVLDVRARDAQWFRPLTAEIIAIRYVKGCQIREWKKRDGYGSEALDCRVYGMAALGGLVAMGLQGDKDAEKLVKIPLKEAETPLSAKALRSEHIKKGGVSRILDGLMGSRFHEPWEATN